MKARVRITAHFATNLDSIREFLDAAAAPGEFDALIARLFDEVVPNLARFPDLGRDFLECTPGSSEGRVAHTALSRKAGPSTALREYIKEDYLILYAVRDDGVFLLSIRHHRQLSFDLREHWR